MGFLYIGNSGWAVEIDDRALAHLKVVILTELRNGNGISFSCSNPASKGSGRETFWITPGTDIRFQFFGSRCPRLNRIWLQKMVESCTASTGLFIMAEPVEIQRVSA
ncbi:ATP-dependent DNA ligase [Herbiconiux sp. P16]|uniref:DUF7882 family protein n=1 Tax=Herbiconiux wuyangfengii TaxID=3342794 RepID=UPI0035B81DB8